MENYKEKYENALATARKLYNEAKANEYTSDIEDYEHIFPELKESEDEKIRKAIRTIILSSDTKQCQIAGVSKSDMFAWLEKQGEQKSTDKVEPKFKVGDWVMLNRPVLITKVEDMAFNTHQYWTSDGTWFGDATKAKLWTIQDAKDGDLLADDYGIYIFDRFDEDDEKSFLCMGAYQYSQKVYENEHMLCSVGVHPATKEQRELLFQKMKEAGYEWNAEKKELKKIEQNPVEWSEEDETHLRDAIYAAENIYTDKCGKEELVDWLKSLRPQKQCALTKLEKSKIWEALNKTYAVDYRDTLYKKIVSRS